MAFRLKRATALKVCADQVQAIISMPRHRNATWTEETLHRYLSELGLGYTLEEVELLNSELHRRGVVEDVAD